MFEEAAYASPPRVPIAPAVLRGGPICEVEPNALHPHRVFGEMFVRDPDWLAPFAIRVLHAEDRAEILPGIPWWVSWPLPKLRLRREQFLLDVQD